MQIKVFSPSPFSQATLILWDGGMYSVVIALTMRVRCLRKCMKISVWFAHKCTTSPLVFTITENVDMDEISARSATSKNENNIAYINPAVKRNC